MDKINWLKNRFPNGIKQIEIGYIASPSFSFEGDQEHLFASLIWWITTHGYRSLHSVSIHENPNPKVEAWKKAVTEGKTYESFETWWTTIDPSQNR